MRIEPGYATASTASRLDAFLLPDSLQFAEYNAESPAGPGYTQRLCELFDALAGDGAVPRAAATSASPPDRRRCSTRWSRATASGAARASPPRIAIVDWREVPTWSEFEILRDAFTDARRADASSAIRAT